jgi:hypothetical protein
MARYAKFFSLGAGGGGTNNLQLPVGTILDATLRQVQDGLGTGSPLYLSTTGLRVGTTAGSAMYWDNTNNRLGVGTNAPTALGHFVKNSNADNVVLISNTDTTSGTARSTIQTQVGSMIGSMTAIAGFGVYVGSSTNDKLLFTTQGNPWANIQTGGNFNIGVLANDLGARLGIKGSGSTSATTSLLVQNSAGNDALKITDDRVTLISTQLLVNDQFGTRILNTSTNNGGIAIGNLTLGSATGRCVDIIQSGTSAYGGIKFYNDVAQTSRIGGFFTDGTARFILQTTANDVTIQAGLIATSSSLYVGYLTYDTLPVSAAVAIQSTTRGFLPPRMTTAQRDAIATPATGLKVYNTTLGTTDTYDGATWQRFGQQTLIKGNTNTGATLVSIDNSTQKVIDINDRGSISATAYNSTVNNIYRLGFYGSFDAGSLTLYAEANANGILLAGKASTDNYILNNLGLGTITPTARLGIKGSGSTSATISFLVQNSTGNSKFFIDDTTVGTDCCIGNLINGYSSLQWNANSVGFGLISGGGLVAKVSNNSSFVVSDSAGPVSVTSAKLVVNSTNSGFLPPRMTTAEKNLIATPANGLQIYDTTLARPCFFNGATWITL